MKTAIEKLESPYLKGELEFVVPTYELSHSLAHAIGESPFANSLDLRGAETGEPAERMENQGAWPYEADESTPQELVSVEANVLDEDEQERSDDESAEDGFQNSASGEAEQSIHGDEASAVDEAYAFVDEAEQWIQGDDLIAVDEASPLDHDDERDSIDYEAVSEVEDEPPKAGSIRPDVDSNKDSLSVTLILDQPAESDDKFQLVGSGGSYTKPLGASDAKALVAGEKFLRFKVKPDKKGYKLIHYRSKGSKRTIFLATPIQDMTKAGHGPQTAEYSYARINSQVPKNLPDRNGITRDVDKDLVQVSPVSVDLKAEDPEI